VIFCLIMIQVVVLVVRCSSLVGKTCTSMLLHENRVYISLLIMLTTDGAMLTTHGSVLSSLL